MTEPLTPEARLAALLHGHRDPDDRYDDPEANRHGVEDCDNAQDWIDEAARLIAAGVTLDAARQPDEGLPKALDDHEARLADAIGWDAAIAAVAALRAALEATR